MVGTAPEAEVARIREWCRAQVPEDVLDRVRVECEVDGRDVTIVERHHDPRPAATGPEWVTTDVARLRHLSSRGVWRLYWPDRNGRWHEYPDLPFAWNVDDLLDEIEADPTAIFWG